jgi:hypothetical protein
LNNFLKNINERKILWAHQGYLIIDNTIIIVQCHFRRLKLAKEMDQEVFYHDPIKLGLYLVNSEYFTCR